MCGSKRVQSKISKSCSPVSLAAEVCNNTGLVIGCVCAGYILEVWMDVDDRGEQHPCIQSCADAAGWGGPLKDTPVAAWRLRSVMNENCVLSCCHSVGYSGAGEGRKDSL